jgi:hypothetical protein
MQVVEQLHKAPATEKERRGGRQPYKVHVFILHFSASNELKQKPGKKGVKTSGTRVKKALRSQFPFVRLRQMPQSGRGRRRGMSNRMKGTVLAVFRHQHPAVGRGKFPTARLFGRLVGGLQ